MATKFRTIRPRALQTLYLQRPYHSYDHPPPPGPFNAVETSILSAAVQHIPSNGFTRTSLSLGAKEAGYIDASTNLFPNGAFTLVHYYLYTQRMMLAQHKQIIEPSTAAGKPLETGGKVKALTWERLMGSKEIIHRWQEVRIQPIHERR
jgi:ubiquinone biosynthesis protein COQ9